MPKSYHPLGWELCLTILDFGGTITICCIHFYRNDKGVTSESLEQELEMKVKRALRGFR